MKSINQNSTQEFTTEEIIFLRSNKLFSYIGSLIKSPRARKNTTVSRIYVRDVVTGKETRDTPLTQEIKSRAREVLNKMFQTDKHGQLYEPPNSKDEQTQNTNEHE